MIRTLLVVIGLSAALWAGWTVVQGDEEAEPMVAVQPAPDPEPAVDPSEPKPAPEIVKVPILTAARNIPAKTPLQAGDMVWTDIARDDLVAGMVRKDVRPDAIERSVGLISPTALVAGDPVKWSALEDVEPERDLAHALASGKSAMAVAVTAETAAGGMIRPGDHVDVVLVGTSRGGDATGSARFLAQGVKVLAVDQTTSAIGKDDPANIRILTLELSRDEVISVGQASAEGLVSVALRPQGDASAPVANNDRPETIRVIRQGGIELVEPSN